MKKFYRLAWLILVFGVLAACSSPPPVDTDVVEEAPDAAVAEIIEEVDDSAPDPTEPPAEVEDEAEAPAEPEEPEEEVEIVAPAVDGPTHVPATNVEEALVEKPYDQTKGAEDPLLTVIEYGDFQ